MKPQIIWPWRPRPLYQLPDEPEEALVSAQRTRVREFADWIGATHQVDITPVCERAIEVVPQFKLIGRDNTVLDCCIEHLCHCTCALIRSAEEGCALIRVMMELAAPTVALELGAFSPLALRGRGLHDALVRFRQDVENALTAERLNPRFTNMEKVLGKFDAGCGAASDASDLLGQVARWAVVTDPEALDLVRRVAVGRAEAALAASGRGAAAITKLIVDLKKDYRGQRADTRVAGRIESCGREFSRIVLGA
jgi:hypothetical protein